MIRPENRCICGHRWREHPPLPKGAPDGPRRCASAKCPCRDFFYMMAEGAWVLRCRCKHKHTDHDPRPPYRCTKCRDCAEFNSPFVCNCDHPWGDHAQVWEERELRVLPMLDEFGDPSIVKRGLGP